MVIHSVAPSRSRNLQFNLFDRAAIKRAVPTATIRQGLKNHALPLRNMLPSPAAWRRLLFIGRTIGIKRTIRNLAYYFLFISLLFKKRPSRLCFAPSGAVSTFNGFASSARPACLFGEEKRRRIEDLVDIFQCGPRFERKRPNAARNPIDS